MAFDMLDQEMLKLPARSSTRVTETINVRFTDQEDVHHIDSPNNHNGNNGHINGGGNNNTSISTTPNPNDHQQPTQNGHGHTQMQGGKKVNFFTMAPPINTKNIGGSSSDHDDGNDVILVEKKSFPDDLSPSTLKSPKSPNGNGNRRHSNDFVDNDDDIKRPMRIIIVCYKLPLKCTYNKESSEWEFEWEDIRNVLANLRVLQSSHPSEYEVNFVGWPGITPSTIEERDNLEDQLYSLKYPCYPLFLSDSQIRDCYKIYCRSILWPLFHYLMPTNDYQFGNNYEKYWQSYVGLNNLYAKKACVAATDNDDYDPSDTDNYIIWFHDYHLLLAPHFVRRQIPLAQIGLFLHTTFPTSEVFRCLPTRKEILRGILSSDLVGFHTYDYARHFLSSCKRILDLDFHTLPDDGTLAVHYLGRDVSLRIGHASILSHDIHKRAQSQKIRQIKENFWKKKLNIDSNRKKKVILGLGELDEVRGTILTIQSFHHFLLNHAEWQNDIIFILCISSSTLDFSPSSHLKSHTMKNQSLLFSTTSSTLERSRSYSNLRMPIEEEINKMKSRFNSDVIQLIDSNNLSYDELLALYTLCDVAVFGTFWDGFNTVPYEFTAAQPSYNVYINEFGGSSNPYSNPRHRHIPMIVDDLVDDERGVPPAVILSEFMGCMRSLCGVFRINPWKISEVASTLHSALCMTSKERRVAHHRRFSHVMKYTLIDWSLGFINDLKKAAKSERNKRVLPIGFGSNLRFIYIPNDLINLKAMQKLLVTSFKTCQYKIILLDYGGTLTDVDEMKGTNNNNNTNDNEEKSSNNSPIRTCSKQYRDRLGITKDLQSISPKIIRNLNRISSDPNTIVAIVSGQTRENLERAFNECPGLFICAEKGAWFRYPGQSSNWVKNEKLTNDNEISLWQNIVHDVLKTYTERTNGSYIQRKSTALVWHYENADPHYGDMQATEAERYLRRIIEKHHNLVVQRYDHCRALEVLPKEIHKGAASLKVIDEMMKKIDYNQDDNTGNNIFIMAVGNDRSDEKMFEAVELVSKEINTEYGFTVRIGMAPTQARFYLTDQNQMLWLLNTLTSIQSQSHSQQQKHINNDYFKPRVQPRINNNLNNNNLHVMPPRIKSRSYSRGLSSMNPMLSNIDSNNNNNNNTGFQPLVQQQKSIDLLPIPPTAPKVPMGIKEFNRNNRNNARTIQNNTLPTSSHSSNSNTLNFDLISPEFSGSFFDSAAVRSHSYTSLSKLAKLSELTEQYSGDRTPRERDLSSSTSTSTSKEMTTSKKSSLTSAVGIHKKRSL